MCRQITTFINDERIELYHGATLKHALLKANEACYKEVIAKRAQIRDQEGNVVDVNGAVDHGFRYYVRKKRNRK